MCVGWGKKEIRGKIKKGEIGKKGEIDKMKLILQISGIFINTHLLPSLHTIQILNQSGEQCLLCGSSDASRRPMVSMLDV